MKSRIIELLSKRQRLELSDPNFAHAAVFLLLFERDGEFYIIFTKRAENLKYHAGQISFPGGGLDQGDESLLDTAFRETFEEIGLTRDDIEVLGALDDTVTFTSKYIITPFVGFLKRPPKGPYKTSKNEIERVIEVPLSALLDESNFREELHEYFGQTVPVYFYNYKGDIIWGATARILKQFLDLLTGKKN
ncbi:MAG: CoA pyrophosphatase [Candidatus Freyrarchaeum guaymaensis]|nr:CoA pyrophosphatase [Candidatus Freyarchaeota archaeon]MDO8091761.1 CoA pyrophosphatase [Candidatus Sigynarchaeota archaeon]